MNNGTVITDYESINERAAEEILEEILLFVSNYVFPQSNNLRFVMQWNVLYLFKEKSLLTTIGNIALVNYK